MQAIYAYDQSAAETAADAGKLLFRSMDTAFDLYLFNLCFTGDIAYLVASGPNPAGLGSLLHDNPIAQKLLKSTPLREYKKKDNRYQPTGMLRLLLKSARQALLPAGLTPAAALPFLFNDIMMKNEEYDRFLEEMCPSWIDDKPIIQGWVNRTFSATAGSTEDIVTKPEGKAWEETRQFAVELLDRTLRHRNEFQSFISGKTRNWDVDRITMIDRILMQMALCEFTRFPTIPVKVTIDEYIELAKRYSTPRSGEFVNGILDKLMHELKDAGKIEKTGRGTA